MGLTSFRHGALTDLVGELQRIEVPGTPARSFIPGEELGNCKEAGIIGFGKWFAWFMDTNHFSHPQLVALCKLCTGDKALLHSSTIAGYRNHRIKNPGPLAFVAIEYVCRAIDAYQRNEPITRFGRLAHLAEGAQIMRDEHGNPVTAGYLTEVFLGLRPVPIDLSATILSDSDAEAVSQKAGRLVRKLMVIQDLDPLEDADEMGGHFPGNPQQKQHFAALIKGQATWDAEEVEEMVAKMARLLEEQFKYSRTTAELLNELRD